MAPPINPMLLLDLPLACSSELQPYRRACPQGLLGHLHQVLQVWLGLSRIWDGPSLPGKASRGQRQVTLKHGCNSSNELCADAADTKH
jgi:hypothetical protein